MLADDIETCARTADGVGGVRGSLLLDSFRAFPTPDAAPLQKY